MNIENVYEDERNVTTKLAVCVNKEASCINKGLVGKDHQIAKTVWRIKKQATTKGKSPTDFISAISWSW